MFTNNIYPNMYNASYNFIIDLGEHQNNLRFIYGLSILKEKKTDRFHSTKLYFYSALFNFIYSVHKRIYNMYIVYICKSTRLLVIEQSFFVEIDHY